MLLDVSAAIAMGARVSRHADRREINCTVPLCLLGAARLLHGWADRNAVWHRGAAVCHVSLPPNHGQGGFARDVVQQVLISTTIRALVFAVGRLMLRDCLLMFAVLLPFALAGLWWGDRLQGRISRERPGRFISLLVLLIGASVLIRAFT